MERWLSGRKHWFAKPTDVYTSRGFKSRSFLFICPRRGYTDSGSSRVAIGLTILVAYYGVVGTIVISCIRMLKL